MSAIDKWRGDLGDDYTTRNQSIDGRYLMWEKILGSLPDLPNSILEVGANIGLNLNVIDELTDVQLIGLEPNQKARSQIVFESIDSTADLIPLEDNAVEMVFTCGVLIHIPLDDLNKACDEIYRVSSRYIICIEYFSDKIEEIIYRGQSGLLWKQDFGKYWMDHYDLSLIDYGFFWREVTGLDNLTYFIFKKLGE